MLVTNTNDSGPGSFRQAILDANLNPGLDTIDFAIPGSGVFTISPLSTLPSITSPVVIDGYSQPGSSPNTLPDSDNAVLLIELSGASAGTSDGLILAPGGDGSTIDGLVIDRWAIGSAIRINASGNVVSGNFIGTDAGGTAARGNLNGVLLVGVASSNTIGGTAVAARNVISANAEGVVLQESGTGGNVVEGNFIGVDATGGRGLPGSFTGVDVLASAPNDTIGGTVPGARNVISANATVGIDTISTGTLVQGNFIGTDATGTTAVGNGVGVAIDGGAFNTIGGTTAAARNLISGNQGDGVDLFTTDSDLVAGNFIGTDVTGTRALGNSGLGVGIGFMPGDPSNNTIGGTAAGAGNVISGNRSDGVQLFGSGTSANLVQGNFIGTDSTGTLNLGNLGNGIAVVTDASGNTLGGFAGVGNNTINFNGGDGVHVDVNNGSIAVLGTNFSAQATVVVTGTLQLASVNAIPATSAVMVAAGATLDLNSFNDAVGSLAGAGTVTLGSATLTTGGDNSSTAFGGVISGTGGLVKNGTGTFTLFGVNTYAGATVVNSGTLRIGATFAVPSTSAVTVAAGGTFDLNTFDDRIGSLAGAGSVILGGQASVAIPSSLLTNGDNTSTTFSGSVSGVGALVKEGSGILTLSGANTFSGTTTVSAGSVLVNGSLPSGGMVSVSSGATLGGSGTLGTIATSGAVSPGGPGTAILRSGDTVFSAGSSFVVKLNGTTPGSGYDQLNATGAVNLSGSPTLLATAGFQGATGNSFTILVSSMGISGTFNGLANNATLTINGQIFQIQYTATSVVLIRLASSTATVLSSSPNPSVFGQAVTFTATVTAVPPATGAPSGSVTFQEGSIILGTANVTASGIATFTTSTPLAVGPHTIVAVYNGDSSFAPSSSSSVTQVVNQGATQTTLSASTNPSVFGQPVAFTATITPTNPSFGTPTGTVQFLIDGMNFGSPVTLANGVATSAAASNLSVGDHFIMAVYSGDASFSGSNQALAPQTVNRAATAATITSSANPSTFGLPVTFTAVVQATPPGSGTPTGTVTFADGTTLLGRASLDSAGAATFTTATLAGGTRSITALYSGDTNFAPVTAPVLTQTIASSMNEAFVTALYRDVLGRLPDPGGFSFWVQQLQAGASRATVALAFEISLEYRTLEVDQFYRALLHRAADAAGEALWVSALVNGRSEADVVVAFLTSVEYTATHPDSASYVSGLYEDVLGHPADPVGAASWQALLQSGAQSRAQLALSFLSSTEAYLIAIDSFYTDLLGRPADSGSEQSYLAALQAGEFTPAAITTLFLASDEFLARAIALAG